MSDNFNDGVAAGILGTAIFMSIIVLVSVLICCSRWEYSAIKVGVGKYNEKTAAFEWITNENQDVKTLLLEK